MNDQSREARLAGLATMHSTSIANYLRRRIYPLPPSELDDLVEEVLLITWRRLDVVPRDAELAWMIGVARNVLNNARRSHNRRNDFAAAWPTATETSSAEDHVVADLAVKDALAALSEGDREVLLLHYWDGLDARQIATALGISVNAAAVRLSRAVGRFREKFSNDENL